MEPLDINTGIDTTRLTATQPVQAEVTPLQPPQDIEVTQVGAPEQATYEGYSATTADPTAGQMEAVTGQVDEDTVSSQRLAGMLSQDSDYMRAAVGQADQMSARRGLLSSSIGVGEARKAAIQAATPFALQEGQRFGAMEQANLQYQNRAAELNAQSEQVLAQFNAGLITQADRDNALAAIQNEQFNIQTALEAEMANAAAANRAAELEAGFEMQAAEFTASALNQAASDFAAETNKTNFQILSSELQAQLAAVDANLQAALIEIEKTYDIQENLDTVNGAIYQQLAAEMGTILANVKDPEAAAAQIETLLHAAGVEYEYINGDIRMAEFTPGAETVGDVTGTAPTTTAAEEPTSGVLPAPTAPDAGVMSYEEWVDSGGLQSISGGDSDDSNWIAMINSQQGYDTASTDAKAAYDEYVQQAQMEALWEQYQANQ